MNEIKKIEDKETENKGNLSEVGKRLFNADQLKFVVTNNS